MKAFLNLYLFVAARSPVHVTDATKNRKNVLMTAPAQYYVLKVKKKTKNCLKVLLKDVAPSGVNRPVMYLMYWVRILLPSFK